jgi:hypothetical protein
MDVKGVGSEQNANVNDWRGASAVGIVNGKLEARTSVLAGERKLERAGEREATTQAGCVGGSPGSRHGERSASRLLLLKRSNPTRTQSAGKSEQVERKILPLFEAFSTGGLFVFF